jgi:Flp pilus assembly protein protease CpaA
MVMPVRLLGPLGLGLILSVVCDLRKRRIPNAVSAWILISGLTVRGFEQGAGALFSGVGAAALVVAALYRPWLLGGIGGGDVKLAAATAAWVPFGRLHWFALSTAAAGGLVAAVCYLVARADALAERAAHRSVAPGRAPVGAVRPGHRSRGGRLAARIVLHVANGRWQT